MEKRTKKELDKMRQMLARRDVEQSDDSTLYDVFMEGCPGWDNFDDSFVERQFFEYYDEETLKGELDR
jgi:hypothetical protein